MENFLNAEKRYLKETSASIRVYKNLCADCHFTALHLLPSYSRNYRLSISIFILLVFPISILRKLIFKAHGYLILSSSSFPELLHCQEMSLFGYNKKLQIDRKQP